MVRTQQARGCTGLQRMETRSIQRATNPCVVFWKACKVAEMQEIVDGPLGFGARLKRLREARQITQAALSRSIGCTGAAIGVWENGSSYPAFWNLVELAKFFGVDLDWLVGMPFVHGDLNRRMKVRDQLEK
jgi:DNA-binding XRE family transcriptional regulator